MSETKNIFPRVICLTLPEQRERQLHVAKELGNVGIDNYEFFSGFKPESIEVKQAYAENRVKSYPDCFRCGKKDCSRDDCNNILLPVQVAVTLSFQAILQSVAEGDESFVVICEDDIVFAGYAKKIFQSTKMWEDLFQQIEIMNDQPVLIRLAAPEIPAGFVKHDIPHPIKIDENVVMSNYFFIVNKAFARIASKKLLNVTHTADMIIHSDMLKCAKCYTLRPQLVADQSWSQSSTESLIHPKKHHIDYLVNQHGQSSDVVQKATERFNKHIKKAVSIKYGFIGSPRCGSHYVSAFLRKNGLSIEHEALGHDGICAWQYAVSSEEYPYILDKRAVSKYFVHIENYYLYVRNPLDSIPSLIVENKKAPLSYAFRRKHTFDQLGVDLNDFSSPIERAVRAYIHWYQLALKNKPIAILQVENFLNDCRKHIDNHNFKEVDITKEEYSIGKLYLGVVPVKPMISRNDILENLSGETLSMLIKMNNEFGYGQL